MQRRMSAEEPKLGCNEVVVNFPPANTNNNDYFMLRGREEEGKSGNCNVGFSISDMNSEICSEAQEQAQKWNRNMLRSLKMDLKLKDFKKYWLKYMLKHIQSHSPAW